MKILVKRKKNDLKTLVVSKLKDKTTDVPIIIIIFFRMEAMNIHTL